MVRAEGADPPPLTASLTAKGPFFLRTHQADRPSQSLPAPSFWDPFLQSSLMGEWKEEHPLERQYGASPFAQPQVGKLFPDFHKRTSLIYHCKQSCGY